MYVYARVCVGVRVKERTGSFAVDNLENTCTACDQTIIKKKKAMLIIKTEKFY